MAGTSTGKERPGGAAPWTPAGQGPDPSLCRDCQSTAPNPARCHACNSPRILRHPQLFTLAIAHVDCDAFYASIEKRDRPHLAHRPVIVGGGTRGVVSTACYIARLSGVHSAMPMFKALKLCPDAEVIKPNFAKYTQAAHQIRDLMRTLTPAVQPLSIDEALLDLTGTEALHGAPPAAMLARFALQVEREIGVTISIGLAANRLLAKLAANKDKPRGFVVWGTEAPALLAPEPVSLLPGVGPALERRLAALSLTRLGQLQQLDDATARRLLGDEGPHLVRRARGEDSRRLNPAEPTKSISAETTFDTDLSDQPALERHLWRLCEKLALRLREKHLAAAGVTLKLKTAKFATRTRAAHLAQPTALPDRLFTAARLLLAREADGTAFRLIGIAASALAPLTIADQPDLADPETPRAVARQGAIDKLREKFGAKIIAKGRAL